MVKVLVCDGDGTLQLPNPSPELRQVIETLPSLGVQLVVVSNEDRSTVVQRFWTAGLTEPEIIVTPNDVGPKKPSPLYIDAVHRLTGADFSEMVYLGDSDGTDSLCAINAGILPLSAKYSPSARRMKYGLPVNSPESLGTFLTTFARQGPPYFGWSCNGPCPDTSSDIDVRAVLFDHGRIGITSILKRVLKHHQDVRLGPKETAVRTLLFYYFFCQCYLSGLVRDTDWIAVYPGHEQGSFNPTLEAFSHQITQVSRDRFIRDLFIRHEDAPKSQFQGSDRNIFDQFRTLHVNPDYHPKIEGKSILVLDDFTTYGFSLETARRMLLRAGASEVVCVAIAKYRRRHSVSRISAAWDPFEPATLKPDDVGVFYRNGTANTEADDFFKDHIWSHFME